MKARSLLCAAVVGALLLGTLGGAHADEKKKAAAKPDATLTLSAKALAAGAGYSWGQGTLTYKGKKYPVSVDGLSIGSVGAASVKATGKVYHLSKLEDFDGNYTAGAAGATIGGGAGAATMKNQNGVVIDMTATTKGVSITLAAAGVSLSVKK